MSSFRITVLSTWADDILVNDKGIIIGQKLGGPAYFLSRVFENVEVSYKLVTGSKMEVKILLTSKGEFGQIDKPPDIKKIHYSKIRSPNLLISSILDEIDLSGIDKYKGNIFLDIQGFVRNGKKWGKKKKWKLTSTNLQNVFCLKGTKEEMRYINQKTLKMQKEKMLIITQGRRGCKIFVNGKSYVIQPESIIRSSDTIGAGDTWFAYFIAKYICGFDTLESARYATRNVIRFLLAKKNLMVPK